MSLIEDLIYDDYLYYLRTMPIGLLNKSYEFTKLHLYRNIGNEEFTYDGYSTPIGSVSEPYYNNTAKLPYFFQDSGKNSTSNYLEYIRNIYGSTLSITNINEDFVLKLDDTAKAVGAVESAVLGDLITTSQASKSINPNGLETDTILGQDSANYALETLRNALVDNDSRDKNGYSITNKIRSSFGIKTSALNGSDSILRISTKLDKNTGRYESLAPSDIGSSPTDDNNEGTLGSVDYIKGYSSFYESLSDISKSFFTSNTGRNKYRPSKTSSSDSGSSYFNVVKIDAKSETSLVSSSHIRYLFEHNSSASAHRNVKDSVLGDVYVYSENENGSTGNYTSKSFNGGVRFGRYTSFGNLLTADDLLKKTNDSFKKAKYDTIIARFHTNFKSDMKSDTTQTAVSGKYGMSHGRNLLKRNADRSQGYDNPYCRVWTHHHQYHRLADAIRPMGDWGSSGSTMYHDNDFSANHGNKWGDGRTRLATHGVFNRENGLVNITPSNGGSKHKAVDVRNCMFSIENLAWKDATVNAGENMSGTLSKEQVGPFGGRIMWFPPYGLTFSESTSANWNENNFIGRGEPIFTYTNTVRTGDMSFILLVDHPSILDYWENRGKSSSNSVDSINDPEQELLRFFAGCDNLKAQNTPVPTPEVPIVDPGDTSPKTRTIKFYVFYPNNYSGVDDANPDTVVHYLLNGFGTGKLSTGVDMIFWDRNFTGDYAQYGGYETRPGYPISLGATNETDSRLIADVIHNGTSTRYSTIEGNKTRLYWQRRWYYRIDSRYKNQDLQKTSYLDRESVGLNTTFGQERIASAYGIGKDDLFSFADMCVALDTENKARNVLSGLYSESKVNELKEIFSKYKIQNVKIVGKASVQGYSKENEILQKNRANTVQKWLRSKKEFSGVNITATAGGTGGKGPGVNNGDESWFINKIYRCAEATIELSMEESKTVQAAQTEAYKSTSWTTDPLGRTTTAGSSDPTDPSLSIKTYLTSSNWYSDVATDVSNIVNRMRNMNNGNNSSKQQNVSVEIDDTSLKRAADIAMSNIGLPSLAIPPFTASTGQTLDEVTVLGKDKRKAQDIKDKSTSNSNVPDSAIEDKASVNEEAVQSRRYDSESRFFELLGKEEPFLHHKISDKVKYFDPAFHSISPEGFNARLTFLHQCTRQGPTISSSDNNTLNNTANNMSFGRPPVCILRLGDFYYTKIIIKSIRMTFEPLIWDLNHEGIGVMPMMAKIDMSFDFIGGSSLGGHITRLQNALSFNYYANTEVYDNRSELASYKDNGDIEEFKAFNPY